MCSGSVLLWGQPHYTTVKNQITTAPIAAPQLAQPTIASDERSSCSISSEPFIDDWHSGQWSIVMATHDELNSVLVDLHTPRVQHEKRHLGWKGVPLVPQ